MNRYADWVLTNGKFFTENDKSPWAEAVAIIDDRFAFVGGTLDQRLQDFIGENTKVMDLHGKMVLPGIIDGHIHPTTVVKSGWRVQLPHTNDLDELMGAVKAYCEAHSPEEVPYFFGECYATEMFDEHGPDKELLDRYISDRPARMQDFTDHSCWYNTMAIEMLGITKDTPDPEGPMGTIRFIRDGDGNPTGWVQEPGVDNFEDGIFEKIGWAPPKSASEEMVLPFLQQMNKLGIVAMLDGVTEGEEAMKLFHDLDKAGKLHFYYEGTSLLQDFNHLDGAIESLKDWRKKYRSKHVDVHTIKYFLDGTNELGSCASLEPFRNDHTGKNYGQLNMTTEQLTEIIVRLNREGIDLHIHMVCDRAFRTGCDAVEKAQKICSEQGDEWKIYIQFAHCELIHPDDMKRVKDLGIIINWSCHWGGGYFGEAAKEYLGEERWNTMYDFTKIIDSGAVVTYSSDIIGMCEANRCNPFFGMECSHTRVDPEFPLDAQVYPGSVRPPASARLSLEELIRGYTLSGAIPFRFEDRMGSIEEGKLAHMVLLDKNIFEVPKNEIHRVEPAAVFFEGNLISGGLMDNS